MALPYRAPARRVRLADGLPVHLRLVLCTLTVHPTNPDTVFLGGLNVIRSTTAGTAFTDRTAPHVDNHAFAWDASGRLLCGNDGGIHRSANLGDSWTALNTGLGTIQLYAGVSLHPPSTPTSSTEASRTTAPTAAGPATPGPRSSAATAATPASARTATRSSQPGHRRPLPFRRRRLVPVHRLGSLRPQLLPAPVQARPTNSTRLVYGTERVFLSTTSGSSWTPISPDLTGGGAAAIRGIAFAPGDPRFIYVATNDGRIQVTEDGGSIWNLRRTQVTGWSRVTRPFAVHPNDPRRAWLAVGHFATDQILATSDAGRTWFPLRREPPRRPRPLDRPRSTGSIPRSSTSAPTPASSAPPSTPPGSASARTCQTPPSSTCAPTFHASAWSATTPGRGL